MRSLENHAARLTVLEHRRFLRRLHFGFQATGALAVKNRRILQRRPWPIARAIGAAARRRNLHPIFPRHCIPSLMKYAG
jgi:hypothetical protein